MLQASGLGDTVDALCIGQSVSRDSVERLVEWAQETGKDVYLVPRFLDIMVSRSSVGQIGDVPLFRLERLGLSPTEAAVKRLMDLVFGSYRAGVNAAILPLDRCCDSSRRREACLLSARAGWARRATVQGHQVPDDGARC